MAMNLEAVLRIAAKVVGLENITALEKGIQGAEKAASQAQGAFKAVVGSSTWQAAAVAAAGFGVAIGLAARAAIDFESSMADVRKVVDGLESPQAFAEMKSEILELSRQMPITARGFAEIYAAAGQSGIAKEDLKGFATLVAQVGVAFDMTAGDAGRSLSQLKVALGLSTEGVRELADAMNYVSNNTGATAASLVEFMTRSGAVGKLAGLSGQQTMAFGAAMIQTGIQSEVAATSFNNMIKALSKGPSMTDRQVGALQRLGYTMVNAEQKEKELTRVVEEQSRQRVESARVETDRITKEINRRYRNHLQALQDNWDDQAAIYEDGIQDQADTQIKALQRQQEAEIKFAQARADAAGRSADVEVQQIQDSYELRINAVRDAVERELKLRRRADRDRQQDVKDRLDEQKDLEVAAVDSRYKAYEQAEKANLEQAKASAKATGAALAAASSQGFADRLQQNAIGTIMEVLGKIRDLPKSQQISVLSDLFGDEARGLAPMIANLGELERVLGLAGAKGEYTGSVLQEALVRAETAANKIQLFQNNLTALQIVIGDTVLPALVKLAEAFGPILTSVAEFAAANPQLTTALVAIGGIVSAFVAAAPFILSTIVLLGKLSGILTQAGIIIAGLKTVFIVAFSGILSWIGTTLLPALLAFFSGPIGWTVLAVAAVVAMAIAFREPLMNFIGWLWNWGEPVRQFWIGLWSGLVEFVSFSVKTIGGVLLNGVKFWWSGIQTVWGAIGTGFDTLVVQPISKAWTTVMDMLPRVMQSVADTVQRMWTGLVEGVKSIVRGMLQYIANQINSVAGLINRLIAGYNALPNFGDIPFVPTFSVPAFAAGGTVNRPTLAMVGEGGEREYIVPESKMASASARYLSGARGADVIPSGNGGRSSGGRAPVINVTTGPVLEFDGKRYVRVEDFDRGMRQVAEGVIGRLRTPAARIALGRA